jgi:hypothetical protein
MGMFDEWWSSLGRPNWAEWATLMLPMARKAYEAGRADERAATASPVAAPPECDGVEFCNRCNKPMRHPPTESSGHSGSVAHFVSGSCGGERCRCGRPATHKLGEEIPHDDPMPMRHNLTVYVCCAHFSEVVGGCFASTSHAIASELPASSGSVAGVAPARPDGSVYFYPHGYSVPCKDCGGMTLGDGTCVSRCQAAIAATSSRMGTTPLSRVGPVPGESKPETKG